MSVRIMHSDTQFAEKTNFHNCVKKSYVCSQGLSPMYSCLISPTVISFSCTNCVKPALEWNTRKTVENQKIVTDKDNYYVSPIIYIIINYFFVL